MKVPATTETNANLESLWLWNAEKLPVLPENRAYSGVCVQKHSCCQAGRDYAASIIFTPNMAANKNIAGEPVGPVVERGISLPIPSWNNSDLFPRETGWPGRVLICRRRGNKSFGQALLTSCPATKFGQYRRPCIIDRPVFTFENQLIPSENFREPPVSSEEFWRNRPDKPGCGKERLPL